MCLHFPIHALFYHLRPKNQARSRLGSGSPTSLARVLLMIWLIDVNQLNCECVNKPDGSNQEMVTDDMQFLIAKITTASLQTALLLRHRSAAREMILRFL